MLVTGAAVAAVVPLGGQALAGTVCVTSPGPMGYETCR
jgi:hypothetical protein